MYVEHAIKLKARGGMYIIDGPLISGEIAIGQCGYVLLDSDVPQEVIIKSIGMFEPLDRMRDFALRVIPFQIEPPPENIDFKDFETKFLVESISQKEFVFEAVVTVKNSFRETSVLPGQVALKQNSYDGIFLCNETFRDGRVCHGNLRIVTDGDVHLTSNDSFSISREHEEIGQGSLVRRLTKKDNR